MEDFIAQLGLNSAQTITIALAYGILLVALLFNGNAKGPKKNTAATTPKNQIVLMHEAIVRKAVVDKLRDGGTESQIREVLELSEQLSSRYHAYMKILEKLDPA